MRPEWWQRIEWAYHGAMERQADQRAAFLAEACTDDPRWQKGVESLLARNASDPDAPLNCTKWQPRNWRGSQTFSAGTV
jgi:hypothetical protein